MHPGNTNHTTTQRGQIPEKKGDPFEKSNR